MLIPPQEAEKIWHGNSDSKNVIQMHHREHPDWFHHRLVWQQLGIRKLSSATASRYRG
jgi:hypothetical protein